MEKPYLFSRDGKPLLSQGFYESMAGRLKQARKERQITQEKLKELSGISINRIRILENNKGQPNGQELISLCHSLDISPNWYIYGTDSPKHVRYIQSNLINSGGHPNDASQIVRMAFIFSVLTPEERKSIEIVLTSMLRGSGRDTAEINSLLNIADTITSTFNNSPVLNEAVNSMINDPIFRKIMSEKLNQSPE